MLKMKARYAKAKTRKERSALIDEAVAMTHYSRKYVIRLLNGSRRHRKHRGRKPSYSGDAHQLLIRIWRAEGYMCPLYLKSIIESAIRDYEELGHDVPPALADELTRMSASTMYRILRPHHIRRAPNKRSGNKASLAAQIPAGPGALEETGEPGILQVDTVALCGGDMRESFFWILHVTDAATQWGALAPLEPRRRGHHKRPRAPPRTTPLPTQSYPRRQRQRIPQPPPPRLPQNPPPRRPAHPLPPLPQKRQQPHRAKERLRRPRPLRRPPLRRPRPARPPHRPLRPMEPPAQPRHPLPPPSDAPSPRHLAWHHPHPRLRPSPNPLAAPQRPPPPTASSPHQRHPTPPNLRTHAQPPLPHAETLTLVGGGAGSRPAPNDAPSLRCTS